MSTVFIHWIKRFQFATMQRFWSEKCTRSPTDSMHSEIPDCVISQCFNGLWEKSNDQWLAYGCEQPNNLPNLIVCLCFFFRWLLLAGGITLQNSPNSLTPFSLIFVKRLNMFLYSMSSITDVCHSRYGSASNSLQVIFFLQYLIIFINSFWSCFHLGSTNENHTVWMVNFIWIVPVYGWP